MREPEWDDLPQRAELQQSLEGLQRRDWELWSIALLLITVFAGGVVAYVFAQSHEEGWVSGLGWRYIWLVILALVALVVLLNAYLIDRKRSLAMLWRRYVRQSLELERAQRQNTLDPLTQTYNRRYFDEVARVEALRSERNHQPLSFLLMDLVDFEQTNQSRGHLTGDQLLQSVARTIQKALRRADLVCRYAGDDFAVLLIDTPPDGAGCAEQRVLGRLAESKEILEKNGGQLRVASACASHDGGRTLESTLDTMEAALRSRVAEQQSASA